MKIAYLVVAHKNPILLGRELRVLASADADFFIHIDQKSNIDAFVGEVGRGAIFLQERFTVHWAGFSIVDAILALIGEALRGPQKYDYFVLLGASEYPLRSKQYIHRFLERHSGVEFIDMVRLPNLAAGKPISHVTKYCGETRNPFLKLTFRLLSRAGLLRRDYRKHLGSLEPYGGEMWWALTRSACAHVLEFTKDRPDIVKFFHNVQVPDETYIQTILGNSPFQTRSRRNLLYRDWSQGGPHPALLSDEHIDLFEASEKVNLSDAFGSGEVLFARKFSDENLGLIDRLDRIIEDKRQPLGAGKCDDDGEMMAGQAGRVEPNA